MDENHGFISGLWRGFYNYQAGGVRHRQELQLSFVSGALMGDGQDGVGAFVIRGSYDPQSRRVCWTKAYIGRHTVQYDGCHEGRRIWGTWKISNFCRGGFMIWPSGLSAQEQESVTESVPVDSCLEQTVIRPSGANGQAGAH